MRQTILLVVVLSLVARVSTADEVRVSHCFRGDTIESINDGVQPTGPVHVPHHSFWPHHGTEEWAEYHFDAPRALSATEVYWLDDTPGGGCPVPERWRLLYRDDGRWTPVKNTSPFGVEKGVFNRVTFEKVVTSALRIELKSRPGHGSGIIEWDIRNDPRVTRRRQHERLLKPLEKLKFEPPRSALIDLIERTEGFSPEAQRHFERLGSLRDKAAAIRDDIESLSPIDPERVTTLLAAANEIGTEQLGHLGPIAFFTRHPLTRPNAANCYIWQSVPERWGCGIRVFNPGRPDTPAKTIFADSDGSIFDMNLSRDAKTLFFSFKRSGEACWSLWEIGVDGVGLKRISNDPTSHNVGAIELPDGDLLFVSTRRPGFTVCQPGPTSNLYVMRRDGTNIRCVSQNTLSDFSPHLLPDGRVLFTRWEYIDRDLTYRQSLWTQNPDGRRYQLFYGNTIRDIATFWQCRPVPGHGAMVVATLAPHHAWPHGAIGLAHNRLGLEAARGQGFISLTPEVPQTLDRSFRWSYRDPFPVSDYQFLVAYGGGEQVGRFALYLLDLCGNKTLIYSEPEMGCYGPTPIRSRPSPPQLAGIEQDDKSPDDELQWGSVLLADVYQGLPEIERGRIKYVQVMEQMRKMTDLSHRAYDQSPVMSYSTYYAKRCWGRVAIEADGSAHFRAPALREIYFQVLDAEGRELQRMTSAIQLMPDEKQSCVGCHEPRNTAPPVVSGSVESSGLPMAFRKPPTKLTFPDWGTDGVVDFVRVVQPVLDEYCVECHGGGNPDGGYDLSGDKTRFFNMAYDNLLGRSRSYRQHDMALGQMLPEEAAREKPLVHFYWLLRTPTAINRPFWTGSHASRLLDYVDTDHCGRMIPLEDRQRLYTWIDANVPYYGSYANSRPRSPGYRDLCTDVASGAESEWFSGRFMEAYRRRCGSCHADFPQPNDHGRIWDGQLAWLNFTTPRHSPALTAHLPEAVGGRGLVAEKDGQQETVFIDTADPDYRLMLDAVTDGRRLMLHTPRADMVRFGQ